MLVVVQLHAGAAPRLPPRRARRRRAGASVLNTDSALLRRQQRRQRRCGAAAPSRCRATAARSRCVLTVPPLATVFYRWPPERAMLRAARPAAPWPLGARWRRRRRQLRGVLGARHAASSCACSTPSGRARAGALRAARPARGDVWHGYLPRRRRRAWSTACARTAPGSRERGHRFNPHKLLLDPYAREIVGRFDWRDAHFGYRPRPPARDHATARDNAAQRAEGARGARRRFDWQRRPRAAHAAGRHRDLRGARARASRSACPACPQALRGTYAGLASDAGHRATSSALGVTAVEPAAGALARSTSARLVEHGPGQLLGLQHASASSAPSRATPPRGDARGDEFRAMVRAAARRRHRGDARRGLQPHRRGRRARPDAQLARPRQRQLVPAARTTTAATTRTAAAAATRWTSATRACCRWCWTACATGCRRCTSTASASTSPPVLGRGDARLRSRRPPSSTRWRRTRCCARAKLIAEPWDIGPGGYQVGSFPRGWLEWNDRFRDTVRALLAAAAAARAASSRGAWPARPTCSSRAGARRASRSTTSSSHDGFTLADLVSYDLQAQRGQRRGQPRRPRPQPAAGTAASRARPPTPTCSALRARLQRALLATRAAGAGHADARRRRRDRPHPGRQQQRLLPGQRSRLGRLGRAWHPA
ncbi:MAG: hypothetical protein MZV49_21585 [Rhodopseudomonas palustris]|nr:hypothetical protein [Rhodopseudomonas palustris]